MNDTIKVDGLTFRVTLEHDSDSGAPWDREDGHGPVTEWTTRSKNAGERVLARDRSHYRYYDFAEAMKLAKRDGWGLSDEGKATLAAKLGREPTPGDIRAEAVEQDYERMRAWCNDEWSYVGVCVQLLDTDGAPVEGYADSVWGVESDGDYWKEVAQECARNIIAEHSISADATTLQRVIQIRPDPHVSPDDVDLSPEEAAQMRRDRKEQDTPEV